MKHERRREIRADDPALLWAGAIEVEHTSGFSRPWRLPHSRISLFPGDMLRRRAAMAAGIRIVLGTDSTHFSGRFSPVGGDELSPVDLLVDGEPVRTRTLTAEGSFRFDGLPAGDRTLELWLPQFGESRLRGLSVDAHARVWRAEPPSRPALVVYGSSITHGRQAASPTRTWPALTARALGYDLTCLGYAGECHLDPMVARLVRDRPADLIVTCLGINVRSQGTFTERSFLPAVLGFLSSVRDGHPGVPLAVISPIVSPSKENTTGPGGMTLAQIRRAVGEAVTLLGEHGDTDLHLIDGPDILGQPDAGLLTDGVHPGPEGHELMARRLAPELKNLMAHH
ncbi:SGNH/GDSL hydrolase family protein [Streptomyces sp. S4.7]|uniref:SGNH/GDSL hydrolase family protein n=1 Tax=Streptomyces sp. S4.7 TaxID=2705439 RepID=UPI0013DC2A60|nr:SGNH/GDSL hydrolase family protein [Streptomyces sp. S4.7]